MIRVPPPTAAVFFVAGLAVLFVSGGYGLSMWLGEPGLPAAELLLLLLPALLFVRLGGYDPAATFQLARPFARDLGAGMLLAAGAMPVAWAIGWTQGFVLPVPPEMEEALRGLVTADTPARMAWLLFAVALTPALCEEAVFRGVLLSSTRHLPEWRAVLLNGIVFGAFHVSFEAPVRFLPTAWVGIVIAWAVLRSRSVWTGVLMHLLNNASIVLLASFPSFTGLVTAPDAPPPVWLVATGALALAAGVGLLGESPRGGRAPGASSTREQP
ncbi:MAG: CPBP family intramembrane metalloprotease [Gemmatimonadetes bacterium]|nr:CPBP family intramembrane metalloprotease [Gemmatimonadota bacterium]